MGIIYTAECKYCNRIYNFDVGVSKLYSKDRLLNTSGDFNLLTLFKEKKRKEELKSILDFGMYNLKDGYGHKILICDTCKNLYSRFVFTLVKDENIFESIFRCHTCRKKLRELTIDEILNNLFECPNCKNKIKFHIIGKWN